MGGNSRAGDAWKLVVAMLGISSGDYSRDFCMSHFKMTNIGIYRSCRACRIVASFESIVKVQFKQFKVIGLSLSLSYLL